MTDEALDLFAKQVILDALRLERENTGETKTGFSPSKKYQHQMSEMVADPQGWCQRKMRPAWKKALRRVAAVFLVATVGASAWLAVDTNARAAFFGWVKEIYETYVVFRHDGITDTVPESADYRPTWLPNGYSEFRVNTSETRTVVIYDNEAGEMIRFSFIQNPDETDWQLLLYVVADTYKIAGNLDVSITREDNPGVGEIDFHITRGSRANTVIEIKRSSNENLIHGYRTQLSAYMKAERASSGIFIVIMESDEIEKIKEKIAIVQADMLEKCEYIPEVIYINGLRQYSASNRKYVTPEI